VINVTNCYEPQSFYYIGFSAVSNDDGTDNLQMVNPVEYQAGSIIQCDLNFLGETGQSHSNLTI
jgi:hypothetical protein